MRECGLWPPNGRLLFSGEQPMLLLPVCRGGRVPQGPLETRYSIVGIDGWAKDVFLNRRGQQRQVHDLGHSCPREAGEPRNLGVIRDGAAPDETLEVMAQDEKLGNLRDLADGSGLGAWRRRWLRSGCDDRPGLDGRHANAGLPSLARREPDLVLDPDCAVLIRSASNIRLHGRAPAAVAVSVARVRTPPGRKVIAILPLAPS